MFLGIPVHVGAPETQKFYDIHRRIQSNTHRLLVADTCKSLEQAQRENEEIKLQFLRLKESLCVARVDQPR